MQNRLIALLLILLIPITGCTASPQPAPTTAPPTAPATPTRITITATVTPTVTLTVSPTLAATPTMIPTWDPIRKTPPTLMLHRSNANFDSVAFLKDFIAILKQNDMHVITYEDISKDPDITAREQGRIMIITIDDIYLRYPLAEDILALMALLREAGYPAVLGVVTEGYYTDPGTVVLLKELRATGWEIASHTDQHINLGEMETTAPRFVYTEIKNSLDKIEAALGARPITLILPFGQMVNDARHMKRSGVKWVVGINGGTTYDSTKDLIYVGRESPNVTAQQTYVFIQKRFNP